MLVLPGLELIFFTVASVGPCSGFVLEAVLITEGCFSPAEQGLHGAKGISAPHPTSEQAGGHQELGGDTAGTADPRSPRGCPIPYGIMLST